MSDLIRTIRTVTKKTFEQRLTGDGKAEWKIFDEKSSPVHVKFAYYTSLDNVSEFIYLKTEAEAGAIIARQYRDSLRNPYSGGDGVMVYRPDVPGKGIRYEKVIDVNPPIVSLRDTRKEGIGPNGIDEDTGIQIEENNKGVKLELDEPDKPTN